MKKILLTIMTISSVGLLTSCIGLTSSSQTLPTGIYGGNFTSKQSAPNLTESATFNFVSTNNITITNTATNTLNLNSGNLTNPVNQNNLCFTGTLITPTTMTGASIIFNNCNINTTSGQTTFSATYIVFNSSTTLDTGTLSFTKNN